MKKITQLTIFLLFISAAAVAQNPVSGAPPAPGNSTPPRPPRLQPVVGEISTSPGVHDPVMAKEGDTYHVYFTGGSSWVSKDMLTWKREKPVFDSTNWPVWIKEAGFNRIGYWAPDISFFNGQYYLYYAVSAFGKNTSAIGVATNKTLNQDSPDFKWIDHGKIIQSYPGKTNWNAIDPNFILDKASGTPWLVFGSFWHGMQLVQLTKDGFNLAESPDKSMTVASRMKDPSAANPPSDGTHPSDAGGNAIEAPFIFAKGDYYYLFVSYDYCCSGIKSDYKIAVGRSKNITGPYLDKDGVDMARGGGFVLREGDKKEFYAVGHNSAYRFGNTDYIVYHGYSVAENGAPKLVIEELDWDKDGWPLIGKRIIPAFTK